MWKDKRPIKAPETLCKSPKRSCFLSLSWQNPFALRSKYRQIYRFLRSAGFVFGQIGGAVNLKKAILELKEKGTKGVPFVP
jgi:hypothetical protein